MSVLDFLGSETSEEMHSLENSETGVESQVHGQVKINLSSFTLMRNSYEVYVFLRAQYSII